MSGFTNQDNTNTTAGAQAATAAQSNTTQTTQQFAPINDGQYHGKFAPQLQQRPTQMQMGAQNKLNTANAAYVLGTAIPSALNNAVRSGSISPDECRMIGSEVMSTQFNIANDLYNRYQAAPVNQVELDRYVDEYLTTAIARCRNYIAQQRVNSIMNSNMGYNMGNFGNGMPFFNNPGNNFNGMGNFGNNGYGNGPFNANYGAPYMFNGNGNMGMNNNYNVGNFNSNFNNGSGDFVGTYGTGMLGTTFTAAPGSQKLPPREQIFAAIRNRNNGYGNNMNNFNNFGGNRMPNNYGNAYAANRNPQNNSVVNSDALYGVHNRFNSSNDLLRSTPNHQPSGVTSVRSQQQPFVGGKQNVKRIRDLPQEDLLSAICNSANIPVTNQNQQPRKVLDAIRPQHTNDAYDIDINWDNRPIIPVWSAPFEKEYARVAKGEPTAYQSWMITWKDKKVTAREIALSIPVSSQDGAYNEFRAVDDSLFDGDFVNIADYDELFPIPIPYATSKKTFEECRKAIKDNPGIEGVLAAMRIINGSGTETRNAFTAIILAFFNEAASVNFTRKINERTVRRMDVLTSLQDLHDVMRDSGNPKFEEWKQLDADKFKSALSNCISASFGRLFDPNCKGYLDLDKPEDVALLLCDDRLGFRAKDGTPGRVMLSIPQDDERQKELKEFLKNVFPILIKRKTVITSLPIRNKYGKSIDAHNFGPNILGNTPEDKVFYQLFAKKGNLRVVSYDDVSTAVHPFVMGVSYDNELIFRRVDTL